jgi:cobyric acid synthase
LHGLFANDAFRHAWVRSLHPGTFNPGPRFADRLTDSLNHLADSVEKALDMTRLDQIVFDQPELKS